MTHITQHMTKIWESYYKTIHTIWLLHNELENIRGKLDNTCEQIRQDMVWF